MPEGKLPRQRGGLSSPGPLSHRRAIPGLCLGMGLCHVP